MKPAVFGSARRAWSDLNRAVSAMPALAVAALAIGLIYVFSDILTGGAAMRRSHGMSGMLLQFLIGAIWNYFMVPFYLGIHRYIILGEVAPGYSIGSSNPRFFRFYGWTLALSAIGLVPSLAMVTFEPNFAVLAAIIFLVLPAWTFFLVRVIVLFPAIAVDAPGVTLANSFAVTRGHFWRIVGILVCTLLPLLIGGVVFGLVFGLQSWQVKLLDALLSVASTGLAIAVASRLYLYFAHGSAPPDREVATVHT